MTLIPVDQSVTRSAPDWFSAGGDPWVIVDQMISATARYATHYFCRACCGELTKLRVHYVVACPYCATSLPFLLDGEQREHIEFFGSWPYDLIGERFSHWCTWHGRPEGGHPDDTDTSFRIVACSLLENHVGPCQFIGGRVRPPTNPVRGGS